MRIPLCLMLGVSLVACCSQPARLKADAFEPNDTAAQATLVVGTLSATMNEGDAPDVFKFTANANQKVRLNIAPQSGMDLGALDFNLTVTAPDGSVPLARDSALYGFGSNQPQPLEFTAPATGDYVLTLKGEYNGPSDAFCTGGRMVYEISTTITNP
jgi:Bacterial pre-peptidase C-terminal domain